MAHEHKLASILDDNTNSIDWCKELDVWVELTELPEEKKALAISLSLRGKAEKAALQLEIKDLKIKGGVTKLKEKLDKHLAKVKRRQLMMLMKSLKDFLSVQMRCLHLAIQQNLNNFFVVQKNTLYNKIRGDFLSNFSENITKI